MRQFPVQEEFGDTSKTSGFMNLSIFRFNPIHLRLLVIKLK